MYDFIADDCIRVHDINGNEILHIEFDADMQTIAEQIENCIAEINNHEF